MSCYLYLQKNCGVKAAIKLSDQDNVILNSCNTVTVAFGIASIHQCENWQNYPISSENS